MNRPTGNVDDAASYALGIPPEPGVLIPLEYLLHEDAAAAVGSLKWFIALWLVLDEICPYKTGSQASFLSAARAAYVSSQRRGRVLLPVMRLYTPMSMSSGPTTPKTSETMPSLAGPLRFATSSAASRVMISRTPTIAMTRPLRSLGIMSA